MANGKLSTQLQSNQNNQQGQDRRITRTQRLRRRRERQREFAALKSEAQRIQKERLSKVQSIEEYEKEYTSLSPSIQQFFPTPIELKEEKKQRIQTNLSKVTSRLEDARQKQNEAERDLNRSGRTRQDEINADAKIQYYEGLIQGLKEGRKQLEQGKDLSFDTILDYADVKGNEREERRRNKLYQKDARKLEEQKIQDVISKIEAGRGTYQRVVAYKKGVAQEQKIYGVIDGEYTLLSQSKAKPLGTKTEPSKLGKATVTQSYLLGGKTLTFTGTEQLYTSPSGDLVTPFGSLGKKESEVLASQNAALEAAQKEREQQAAIYLSEEGFDEQAKQKPQRTSILGEVFDYAKSVYAISPFGTALKLPDEYLEARKAITVKRSQTGLPKVSLYTLDLKTAYEGVKAQRRKTEEARLQSELVGELGDLTEKAPEEIQYEVQQRGINILKGSGLDTTLDEKTGLIKFTSPALTPSKTFNIYELEKARDYTLANTDKPFIFSFTRTTPERSFTTSLPYQTRGTAIYDYKTDSFKAGTTDITLPAKTETTVISPYSIGVRGRIIATKAAEFYLIGKGIGTVIGVAAKGGGAIYSGLGGGLKVADTTVRAGKVTATVQKAAGLGKTGSALKIAGTSALFIGGGGLYVAGKAQQRRSYEEQYGDIGKEAFKYETIGELVGIGALIGEGVYKRNQARKLQERIARENYLRRQRAERLRNVKLYGQNSRYAQVSYRGAGTGRKLSSKEINELAKLYSEATGVSKTKAVTAIKESGLYKQSLKVGSPQGFRTEKFDRFALITSRKYTTGASKEFAFEFTKRGSRLSNIVIKTTSGKGKYALTSVFEKARFAPTQPNKNFRLQQTVISKIIKSRSSNIGTDYNIKAFNIENRLVKYYPYGKERIAIGEALKIGLPKYSQTELAKIFIKAGRSARTSALPIANLRIETPAFRDVAGIKVAKEGYYDFGQIGRGGRQVALKNLLKDLEFRGFEQTLRSQGRRTPLSVTFSKETNLISTLKAASGKSAGGAVTKASAIKTAQLTVKDVAVSPVVQSNIKARVAERLIGGAVVSTAPASRSAVLLAVTRALRLRSRQQLSTELRARQIQRQVPKINQAQRQQQQQQQRLRSSTIQIQALQEPTIKIKTITPTIPDTPIGTSPRFPVIAFPDREFVERKLRRRRVAKGRQQAFLLPDFATRILGLAPQRVGSTKEALREIQRIKTGLELRRGLIVQ